MAIGTKIEYANIDKLCLDPMNPRLGRNNTDPSLPQDKIRELMSDWTLEELAVSFLQGGGYWPNEAMVVVEEELYGERHLVVVEGNRRLAALRYLRDALNGNPASKRWEELAKGAKPPETLFTRVPYFLADSRRDVEAFLGFRHVTGIKEWHPAEKAQYITMLVDDRNMSYEGVRRMIGSKAPTVRNHYKAYRLLLQIEDNVESLPKENLEERFSVMMLSLRAEGVRDFLGLDLDAVLPKGKTPVSKGRVENLRDFALWTFGDQTRAPLFTDSRLVDQFGRILASKEAVQYLRTSDAPVFEVAYRIAGGDEEEIVNYVDRASDDVELALTRAHAHTKSKKLQAAVARFGLDAFQLLSLFPSIRSRLEEREE